MEEKDAEQKQDRLRWAQTLIAQLRSAIGKTVVVPEETLVGAIAALIGGGHLLIEGVPGLGKTLLARTLAAVSGGECNRVQFTPDLLPSDITGHVLYDMKSGEFRLRRGPVFCHVLLADEINRAPAKTQAALLEAMQEKQVTLEGRSLPLEEPFLVIATQNPLEQEGTYPLPQSQLDRFMLKLHVEYPDEAAEMRIVQANCSRSNSNSLHTAAIVPVARPEDIRLLQGIISAMTVDAQILAYVVRLVRATREWAGFDHGAGPRGGIALLRTAQAAALINGRSFVLPDDIKRMTLPVLRHRVKLSADMELEGYSPDDLLHDLIAATPAPRA
ncbi:MAG: MoxR family ATPase [bacterium]|nr:MoxR family ATPase [bacterium]